MEIVSDFDLTPTFDNLSVTAGSHYPRLGVELRMYNTVFTVDKNNE
jgi:hypothetical protein